MVYLKTNLIYMNVVSLLVRMQHHVTYKISERFSSGFLHLLLLLLLLSLLSSSSLLLLLSPLIFSVLLFQSDKKLSL